MIDISEIGRVDNVLLERLITAEPEVAQYVREMELNPQQRQLLKDILAAVISYDIKTFDTNCPTGSCPICGYYE